MSAPRIVGHVIVLLWRYSIDKQLRERLTWLTDSSEILR